MTNERQSNRIQRLITALLDRTRSGSISWEQGPTYSYIYRSPTGSIIVRSRDNDGVAPFQVTIANDEGVVVRELNSRGADDIGQLYREARDSASGLDETLDGFLRELSE